MSWSAAAHRATQTGSTQPFLPGRMFPTPAASPTLLAAALASSTLVGTRLRWRFTLVAVWRSLDTSYRRTALPLAVSRSLSPSFSLSGWLSPSVWPIPSGKSVRLFENGNQCLRGYLTKTILKMWDCLEFRYLCNNVFHVETLWNFPFQLYCVSLRPVAIS